MAARWEQDVWKQMEGLTKTSWYLERGVKQDKKHVPCRREMVLTTPVLYRPYGDWSMCLLQIRRKTGLEWQDGGSEATDIDLDLNEI